MNFKMIAKYITFIGGNMRKNSLSILFIIGLICFMNGFIYAKTAQTIKLLKPEINRGVPLMQAFQKRQSSREFSDKKIPIAVLSNLLWSANGINRIESGKRTAPSAMNAQEIDIYVVMQQGAYIYNAKNYELNLIIEGDLREQTGKQDFVGNAPLNLVYVADYSKMQGDNENDKKIYSAADTGFISQNVYLFCASFGLGTVVRGWVDKDKLAKSLNLNSDQKVVLAQTVGYKK